MSNSIKSLNCQVSGNTVYIRDERGNIVDQFSFNQPVTMAQSFGRGVSITCGTFCWTYELDEKGKLYQTGMYGI